MRTNEDIFAFACHFLVLLTSVGSLIWFAADGFRLPDGVTYIDAAVVAMLCFGCGVVHEIGLLRTIVRRRGGHERI